VGPLKKQIEGSNTKMTTISLHTKYSGHDTLFLSVHPIILSLVVDNLKRMGCKSTVALASVVSFLGVGFTLLKTLGKTK
jgi:hypothetical protein